MDGTVERETGVCVRWNGGYGFLSTNSGIDVFVHHSEIEGEGFRELRQGEGYSFVRGGGR